MGQWGYYLYITQPENDSVQNPAGLFTPQEDDEKEENLACLNFEGGFESCYSSMNDGDICLANEGD